MSDDSHPSEPRPGSSGPDEAYSPREALQQERSRRAALPWLTRNGFPDWLVAFAWMFLAMILFQAVGAGFSLGVLFVQEGPSGFSQEALMSRPDLMFLGNSVGQIAGLGVATLLVALLSAPKGRYAAFMRFRMPASPALSFGTAALLMIVVQPLLWTLGWINQKLPLPEAILSMEQTQVDMIANLLTGSFALWFLVLNIGVVPAVCEEIMFRSYLHRLFENALGIGAAIVVTGLLFGLFHLRLTQLLPLAAIGMLLGWMTVRSGSVFPAMLMHFMHNSGTVAAVHGSPDLLEAAETAAMPPLWAALASLVLAGYLVYLYQRNTSTSTNPE